MQGYDSVCIARKYGACDLELGGNDQYFNLLAGRRIMGAFDMPKQDIMTFDLLLGTDGEKMSKTKPNCILIDESPQSMYQKLINIKDDMILHYFELATDATLEEIETIKSRLADGEHPNNIKKELAQRIVTMYHGKPYDENDISNVELVPLGENEMVENGKITIANLLKAVKFCATSGDVRNAVSGGSVRLDGEKIEDIRQEIILSDEPKLLQMGKKKAVRVIL